MIKELIQKKTEQKKQACRQLEWQIAVLKAEIEKKNSDGALGITDAHKDDSFGSGR